MGLILAKATQIVWPPNRRQKLEVIPAGNDRVNSSKFDAIPPHMRAIVERELNDSRNEFTHELDIDAVRSSRELKAFSNGSDATCDNDRINVDRL